jgi:hypothetical protein
MAFTTLGSCGAASVRSVPQVSGVDAFSLSLSLLFPGDAFLLFPVSRLEVAADPAQKILFFPPASGDAFLLFPFLFLD